MPYYLRSFDSKISKVITKQDFESLRKHYDVSIAALQFEKAMYIVLLNYLDYESFLLNNALQYSITKIGYEQLGLLSIESNRFISNLLAAIYNYVEYSKSQLKLIAVNLDFNAEKKKIFANTISLKFMEELRHYTQHYGFPVSTISIHKEWKHIDAKELAHCAVIPRISLDMLQLDHNFLLYQQGSKKQKERKKIVDAIIEQEGSSLELTASIREYVDAIWALHRHARTIADINIQESQSAIIQAISTCNSNTHPNNYCIIECTNETSAAELTLAQMTIEQYNRIVNKFSFNKLSDMLISTHEFSSEDRINIADE